MGNVFRHMLKAAGGSPSHCREAAAVAHPNVVVAAIRTNAVLVDI